MGLFEKIFAKPRAEEQIGGYFKLLSGYTPVFNSYDGSLYEMEITRAAIHAFATHVSKLKPEVSGPGNAALARMLQYKPNHLMDTSKFLYRLATIYAAKNNAFITPVYADDMATIIGYMPISPERTEIMEIKGQPFLRFTFSDGRKALMEMDRVGVLTQHQFNSDLFGNDNAALNPTMQMLAAQAQGIVEGVKNSASIRFMAKLAQTLKDKTIEEERQRFAATNLSSDNTTGVMLFDAKYSDVKQIESKPFVVDKEQMELIHDNVYSYFGVHKGILQNKWTEDEWNAFYEGKIEPFAIQLSLVMTNMTFTDRERSFGNGIMWTANRLQYATNATKLSIVTQLFDRGFMTHNQGLEIFNMAPIEDGDKLFIRREYAEVDKLDGGSDTSADESTGTGVQGNAPAEAPGAEGEADTE